MFDVILVPLDGSHRAETILRYVEDVALTRKATVILLQVVEPGTTTMITPYEMGAYYYDESLANEILESAKTYLAGVQGEFREKGVIAEVCVEKGPVVRTILDIAERENVSLIAMASHGRTGLARVFYGSVAAGVLHQADRPLLLVRALGEE